MFQTAALIPDLQRQRAAQQHQLEVLTGHNPNTRALAAKPLRKVLVQPTIPVGLPSELLQRRPDIVEVEETLKAANARIGEARAYFFPTVAITGTGGFRTSEFDQWFKWASRAFSIGPSITLPIFEGLYQCGASGNRRIPVPSNAGTVSSNHSQCLPGSRGLARRATGSRGAISQSASRSECSARGQRACRHSLSQRTGDLFRCLGCGTNGSASRTDVSPKRNGPASPIWWHSSKPSAEGGTSMMRLRMLPNWQFFTKSHVHRVFCQRRQIQVHLCR